jgi:hypothetical protein
MGRDTVNAVGLAAAVFQKLDAQALTNKSRQTVFVAASCDVGKFNDPAVQSMGEDLVLSPNGGAVAVVSATELAFSNLNANLNLQLFQHLFSRDATTGQFETPVSRALLAAKSGVINNQKYQVMGDAAVKPAFPRLRRGDPARQPGWPILWPSAAGRCRSPGACRSAGRLAATTMERPASRSRIPPRRYDLPVLDWGCLTIPSRGARVSRRRRDPERHVLDPFRDADECHPGPRAGFVSMTSDAGRSSRTGGQ